MTGDSPGDYWLGVIFVPVGALRRNTDTMGGLFHVRRMTSPTARDEVLIILCLAPVEDSS